MYREVLTGGGVARIKADSYILHARRQECRKPVVGVNGGRRTG